MNLILLDVEKDDMPTKLTFEDLKNFGKYEMNELVHKQEDKIDSIFRRYRLNYNEETLSWLIYWDLSKRIKRFIYLSYTFDDYDASWINYAYLDAIKYNPYLLPKTNIVISAENQYKLLIANRLLDNKFYIYLGNSELEIKLNAAINKSLMLRTLGMLFWAITLFEIVEYKCTVHITELNDKLNAAIELFYRKYAQIKNITDIDLTIDCTKRDTKLKLVQEICLDLPDDLILEICYISQDCLYILSYKELQYLYDYTIWKFEI